MPNLTANQAALIRYIVAAHKGGKTAKVEVSWNRFNSKTLSSLVGRGVVRHLHFYPLYSSNRAGEPMPCHRSADGPVFEVELTRQGWDHVYGFKSQPTAVAA